MATITRNFTIFAGLLVATNVFLLVLANKYQKSLLDKKIEIYTKFDKDLIDSPKFKKPQEKSRMRLSPRLFAQLSPSQKLIYEGSLSKRIKYLKCLSIVSSVGLASSYKYVIAKKGFSVALAGMGFAFSPFLLSPFIIAWFFKRYVTRLYYNPEDRTFTAHHYGLLLNEKAHQFRRDEIIRSDVTSMLNTFKVGKKPFFLHDEDLKDPESVQIYKHMLGLDNDSENKSNH